MNPQHFPISDRDRFRLRSIAATIDRALSRLGVEVVPGDPREVSRGLQAAWAQLVELLALELAPEVRQCPACKHACMRAAPRCGHCWAALGTSPAAPNRA